MSVPTWMSERGRIAALTRSREPDDPELLKARANLNAEMLAEHAKRYVAKCGPLTEEQLGRLVAIFIGGERR